jgi:ketosteroid isomerase-like protein
MAAPRVPAAPAPAWRPVPPGPAPPIVNRGSMVVPIAIVVGLSLLVVVAALVLWLGGMFSYLNRGERSDNSTNSQSSLATPTVSVSRNPVTPGPTPAKAENTPTAPGADPSVARTEINSTMALWAESLRQQNLNDNLSLYADELEVFYGLRNVGKGTVRSNRQTIFNKYYTSTDVQLSNLRIEVDQSGTRADVFYDNTYDWRGGARTMAGKSHNQMVVSKINGHWLIVSEIHLQQYFERKQD